MSIFISSLRNEFDIVIFDTPPALPVTDSAVLATKVDGMLIVTRAGVTKQSHVAGVVEILENLNAKILGVILNMVPLNARGEEYGYSYNRYDSKSKYGYNYGYGTSEPYGPIVIQSNQQSNSDKNRKCNLGICGHNSARNFI
jgi:Mrp family chromosome partitioning ATPase